MNGLIDKLSSEHKKRPFWKNRKTFLTGWACFNFLYFFSMSLFGSDLSLNSSIYFPLMMLLVSFISWILVGQFMNQESEKPAIFYVSLIFSFILLGLLYENVSAHTMTHTRTFSVTTGDYNCFLHSVLRSLLPAFLFPLLMNQFYVIQKKAAIFVGAVHLTMMSLILTELRCHDREMWHLVLGHQFSLIGVLIFLFMAFALFKRKTF